MSHASHSRSHSRTHHGNHVNSADASKRKDSSVYSQDLCNIMKNTMTKQHKLELFDKIFEILDQDVVTRLNAPNEELWYDTCNRNCPDSESSVKDIIMTIFYTKGKHIFNTKTHITSVTDGLPRILFFELLLHLIEKLDKKTDYDKDYFKGFITTVNRSDNSGILSNGVSDIEYFMMVTTENKEKIQRLLRDIDSKFTTDAPRQGNYTLTHVISSYCNLILRRLGPHSRPHSQPYSRQDSLPEWGSYLRLATPEEISFKSILQQTAEVEQRNRMIEAIRKRDTQQVDKFRLERQEHKRRMLEKKKQEDTRPDCNYDGRCFQQGEQHWKDFQHKKQQGPVERPRGGRRRQTKRTKYNTVRCSPSSTRRHPASTKRRTKRRRRY